MTKAKVYEGFHDDKKVEEHWITSNIEESRLKQRTVIEKNNVYSVRVVITFILNKCGWSVISDHWSPIVIQQRFLKTYATPL